MSATTEGPLLRLDSVTTNQQEAHFASVAAQARAEAQRRNRRDLLKTLTICALLPVAVSGWVYRETHPLVQQEVRYIPLMPDGTVVNTMRWEYLPLRDRNVVILNSVWNYIRQRESYSRIGMGYAWNAVLAMSNEDVGREYRRLNDPRAEGSPYKRYGEDTRVDVAYESHRVLCDGMDCGPNDEPMGLEVRFKRQEVTKGVAGPTSLWITEVRFDRNVAGLDPDLVATVNGAALRINYYRPAQPVGAQQGAR
jgi:type IV secretory pathway component VirB8